MFVTGRPSWRFLSYRRHFPPLVLLIERDDGIQAKIRGALDAFLEVFAESQARMAEMNGGPPKHRAPAQPKPEYVMAADDVPIP